MKNITNNKKYNVRTIQVHMDPPTISLIKRMNGEKPNTDYVKIKIRRDPTPGKLDLYEFKMVFFDNIEPQEFLMFIRNFNMTLKASGTLKSSAKIQCLCTLTRGEEVHHFDMLSSELGSATTENLTSVILGLGLYYFPVNTMSKQKRTMRRRMRNQNGLKVRKYAACLVDLNE